MSSFSLNNCQLSFKQFLEIIIQKSGLSKEEFYKYKIVLLIPDLEIYNLIKNNPRIYYSQPMEIKTNEDLQKCKVMLPILDSNVYYVTRKNANLTFLLEKRNEEELKDLNYRLTLDKIEENEVKIDAELNEFYAKTEVTQYYVNHLNNPVELVLKFPYNSSVQFSKFNLDINGKKVISKVIEKEKAKEKYSDALASGNTGAISSQKDDYIVVNIGNIASKSIVKLTTEFIQFLISEDMSYCYSTLTKFPAIFTNQKKTDEKLKNLNIKITIKAHSKITRLVTKGMAKNKNQKFNEDFTQCVIEYLSSEVDMKYQKSKKSKKTKKIKKRKDSDDSESDEEEKYENEKGDEDEDCFKILFRTEKMNNFNLITQYDPSKDETSCIMSMIYNRNDIAIGKDDKPDMNDKNNYIELYQKNLINNYPSLFIFLIDQSGSMGGKPIKLVKETLLFFLQSLPKNSFYQLIGFGSSINYIYSQEPVEYTVDNVNRTISKIKKLEANLGGTELYEPLKYIFNNKNYDNLKLCRNLFILTDGEVWDRKKSLKLIEENLDVFRVHSFGIGDDFDRNFIQNSGKNGSYCFIEDIAKIKSNVIQTLNKTLRNYLFDCKISVNNLKTEYSYFTSQRICYQDEFLNFYFIIKNKINNVNIDVQYYDKNELVKKNYIFDNNNNNYICENDGDIISKIIIGNILNNTSLNPEKNIELSRRYQVLSKYTSLYAEIENEFKNQNEMSYIEQSDGRDIHTIKNKNDSDSDSDSDDGKCKKKSRCIRKKKNKRVKKKMASDSEDESESESESKSEEEAKCKKSKDKCKKSKCKKKKISSESESEEEDKCEKKCKKREISDESESEEEEKYKIKINKKGKTIENFDIKEMILSQNIIDGNWSLNSQTKVIVDSHIDLYNKIKQYVDKFDVGEKKEDIIITILIIYYLKNNKEIDQSEYTIIVNKGLEYLQSIGIEELLFKNIESKL